MMYVRLLITFYLVIAATNGLANNSSTTVIPASLSEWQAWVLRDQIDQSCPRIAQQEQINTPQRRCIWPGQLTINVHSDGANFTQQWQVITDSWLQLPGDSEHWPSAVTLNNQAAPVLERNGKPVVRATVGNHTLKGQWHWQKAPQYLSVPKDTALISLNSNGQPSKANIDPQGRLWLRDQGQTVSNQTLDNTLQVVVFRSLDDGIPMRLDTELRITVAGKPREITIGQLLPDNAEALNFQSPLPARIEADGRLKIQARAGEWRVNLQARFLDQTSEFTMLSMDKAWPTQEIWSFRAAPHLRGVKPEGLTAIDPSQIDVPERFANLPTFLMTTDSTLKLQEQYRGDASPAANRLTLQRTLWLDFDGAGATSKDTIRGTMNHGWRLSASPELQLGRLMSNGTPQLVTRMADEQGANLESGVEIRQANVEVEAINRIAPLANMSANGWQHDFDKVDLSLQLPPGWQLWHASGPDKVTTSWLSRWDLWDLFICLLIVAGLLRTLNWRWALIGAATLALTYHESGSPLVSWVLLVAALPLLKALPSGKFKQVLSGAAYLTLTGLLIIIIAFAVQQIRRGLYPQLEQDRAINAERYNYAQQVHQTPEALNTLEERDKNGLKKSFMDSASSPLYSQKAERTRYRPSDNIQTGPGEPAWQWQQVQLSWSGPVSVSEPLKLYLSPPLLTRSLKFIQIALVALLFYGLARPLLREHPLARMSAPPLPPGITSFLLPILLLAGFGLQSPPVQAQTVAPITASSIFPPEHLLDALKAELIKAPACVPECASIQKVLISLDKQQLTLQIQASAGTQVAFPLPMDKSWQATAISVDSQPSPLAQDNNKLWVQLEPGLHNIVLTAAIEGDNLNIPFALTPHNTSVQAPGWRILGVSDGQVSSSTVQLEKEVKQVAQDTLLPAPIQPFVYVDRQLNADIDWELVTTVVRAAPSQGAINMRIPLLSGESVISQNMLIKNQQVLVSLAAKQRQVQWRSIIKPNTALQLSAAKTQHWVERWHINASPRWHISGEGIPPVKTGNHQGPIAQRWQPWPGETLALKALQPEPVPGPTTTIESIALDYSPGKRSAALQMNIQIRTSLGGDYRFKPPADAELQSMSIDGIEQTRPKEEDLVVVPLHPGLQTVLIKWQLQSNLALNTFTPIFNLPTPANNIGLTLRLPEGRWPLLLKGPDIGPAMLYWGVLAVIIAITFALGLCVRRLELAIPVKTWQWLLLAIGMSTVNMVGSLPVILWFFAMEARRRKLLAPGSSLFNLQQIGLIALSLIALLSLFYTIPQSLLSLPDMQVVGNGSSNYYYQWYQDHSTSSLPQAWVFSLPLWIFRLAMLLWSMWLVFALINWIKWGWQCLSSGKLWDNPPPRKSRKKAIKQPGIAAENK